MLPSQISRTAHFGSRRSLSISERADFHSLTRRQSVRIKKIKINSIFMLRPADTVVCIRQIDFPPIPPDDRNLCQILRMCNLYTREDWERAWKLIELGRRRHRSARRPIAQVQRFRARLRVPAEVTGTPYSMLVSRQQIPRSRGVRRVSFIFPAARKA